MIKCPKCNFEQPPDTYCANCGVNMAHYKPAPTPILKVLLTNWMVHLTILITMIVGLVLYDRSSQRHRRLEASVPNSSASSAGTRESHASPPSSSMFKTKTAPIDEPPAGNPESMPAAAPHAKKLEGVSGSTYAPLKTTTLGVLSNPTISILFYQGSKNIINDLQKEAQAIAVNGDAIGGLISKKKLSSLRSSEMQNLARNNYKEVHQNEPILLFKGHRHPATGKNIGLSVQVTPLKKDGPNTQIEVKTSSNLRDMSSDEVVFTSELQLNSNYVAFLTGFLPRPNSYNDEDKTIFESDRILKIYNTNDFWSENADLIMIIELNE